MKKYLFFVFIIFYSDFLFAQKQGQEKIDSLVVVLKKANEDAGKVNTLNALAYEYRSNNPDTAIYFANEGLKLAMLLNYNYGVADAYLWLGISRTNIGDYSQALKNLYTAVKLNDEIIASILNEKTPERLKLKGRSLNGIGNIYKDQGKYKDAIKIYFAALKISKELQDKKLFADSYSNIGVVYKHLGNYNEALKIYFTILELQQEMGEKQSIANTYNNIAIIFMKQGNYTEALKNHFQALKLRESIGDKKGVANSFVNIGHILIEQGSNSEALKNYVAALKIKKEIGDNKGVANSYNNIGFIYEKEGNYSEALRNYFSALRIKEKIGDVPGIENCYGNIGNIYGSQSNYPEALKYFMEALKIAEEIGNKDGIMSSYQNIGILFLKSNKIKEAYHYLNRSLAMAIENGSLSIIKNSYFHISLLDSMQGNYKQAFEDYKLFITYRDSLFNEENTKKTVQIQMQYDFDKKEATTKAAQDKKDLLTQTEIQKEKALRNNVATGGGIFIVASFVSFIFYRRKREAQMQADISAARVKTMTAQIEKHFVFGSLSSVRNLIEENPQKANELITRSSRFLRTTLNLSESTTISLKQELEATENYLQIEKIQHDDKFDFKIHIEDGINAGEIMVPPLIFQPIVENSIKHGFHGIDYKGQVDINISKSGSQLICKIADNGIGFKENQDKDHKSFGTKLTKERLELFNKLHSENAIFGIEQMVRGILVTLTIPYKSH